MHDDVVETLRYVPTSDTSQSMRHLLSLARNEVQLNTTGALDRHSAVAPPVSRTIPMATFHSRSPSPFPGTITQLIRDAKNNLAQLTWERLVDGFREPIEKIIRRKGQRTDEPFLDEVFFCLCHEQVLASYDRSNSQFRCFVQGVVRHLLDEWDDLGEVGGRTFVESLERYADHGAEPIEFREQQDDDDEWARALLKSSFAMLRSERPMDSQLLADYFGLLGRSRVERSVLCERTGRSDAAIRTATGEAKARLRALIHQEIQFQCTDQLSYEDEVSTMLDHLRRSMPSLDNSPPAPVDDA